NRRENDSAGRHPPGDRGPRFQAQQPLLRRAGRPNGLRDRGRPSPHRELPRRSPRPCLEALARIAGDLSMDLRAYLAAKQTLVQESLDHYLPRADDRPERLHEAIRYSVLAPG